MHRRRRVSRLPMRARSASVVAGTIRSTMLDGKATASFDELANRRRATARSPPARGFTVAPFAGKLSQQSTVKGCSSGWSGGGRKPRQEAVHGSGLAGIGNVPDDVSVRGVESAAGGAQIGLFGNGERDDANAGSVSASSKGGGVFRRDQAATGSSRSPAASRLRTVDGRACRARPAGPSASRVSGLRRMRQGPADRQPARPYRPALVCANEPFPNPAQLLVVPDHYVFPHAVQPGRAAGEPWRAALTAARSRPTARTIWRRFAELLSVSRHPDAAVARLYFPERCSALTEPLSAATADFYYDTIAACLKQDSFRPRALFERFNIEVIATTEGALDDLRWHKMIRDSGWKGRVVTAYRPDSVSIRILKAFATI
jgi:hypothetical protein